MIGSVVLGGGCFWCIEAVMQQIHGVVSATPGYAGGNTVNPHYDDVVSGSAGHAEVVKIEYDDQVISLPELLREFFTMHDPTAVNQQGADIGPQYRSAIYYTDERDRSEIEETVKMAQQTYDKPIVTEIKPLDVFYEAEAYHHDYFRKNPYAGYCQAVIAPKLYQFAQRHN